MIDLINEDRFNMQQCYLLLTRRCNLACSHCIRSSDKSFTEFIDMDLVEKVFSEISSKTDCSQVTMLISGGEPTLHKDFLQIIRLSTQIFPKTIINTNGLNIKSLLACQPFRERLSIQISIDGSKPMHESIRGKNTFSRTLENVDILAKSGLSVTVATTVSQFNFNDIVNLDKDLNTINFKKWNIKRLVGYGRADDDGDVLTSEWNALVTETQKYGNNERISIKNMFSLQSLKNVMTERFSLLEMSKMGCNCGTGRSKLYINPNGTAYPCACMEHKIVGDFRRQDYEDIKNNLESLDIFPKRNSICHLCNVWSLCQGGCPGVNERFDRVGDIRCPIVKQVNKSL